MIGGCMTVALVSYYLYYPTLKAKDHEESYAVLMQHLEEKYPGQSFDVYPSEWEDGAFVGEFQVNRKDTPEYGVTLHIKDGIVEEFGHWSNVDYTSSPDDVWKFLYNIETPTLEQPLPKIEKVDQWQDGELIVTAVDINKKSAIAIFYYSKEAMSVQKIEHGDVGTIVEAQWEDKTFTFIPRNYEGNVPANMIKGKLYIQ